ncbi:MAG: type II toxin-antitoxin system PemK/MazF family toxin [Chloroflexi bacterium]|nr:type II toxin-antitoxin system PemK/MazF family toxin [Chloroflexota bacterium]
MVIKRGEIWWASLGKPSGSESGYRRPLLIIQSNEFNRSRINTVMAAVITSNLRLAKAPGNVLLTAKDTGLKKDSVVNVSQVITVDKVFLTKNIGKLSSQQIETVNNGLRLAMSLSG